jgi:hypothetical protein
VEAGGISEVHEPSAQAYESVLDQVLCLRFVARQEIGEPERVGSVGGVELGEQAPFDPDRTDVYLLHPRPPPFRTHERVRRLR